MPIKVLLNGCNGKMGRMVAASASKAGNIDIVAGMDIVQAGAASSQNPAPGFPVFDIGACNAGVTSDAGGAANAESLPAHLKGIDFDVIVDFSHPSALGMVLALAIASAKPVVLGTTGYTDAQHEEISMAAKIIPVFQTANMSIGINLMAELIRTAAAALADGFDIELVEAHHNQKLDAPSGTAYLLADAMRDELGGDREYIYDRHSVRAKRGKKEIGIHAIRGGTIVGEHEVIFAGNDEVLRISHSASSRALFADGAIRAVRFMAEAGRKPSRYSMRDVIRAQQ